MSYIWIILWLWIRSGVSLWNVLNINSMFDWCLVLYHHSCRLSPSLILCNHIDLLHILTYLLICGLSCICLFIYLRGNNLRTTTALRPAKCWESSLNPMPFLFCSLILVSWEGKISESMLYGTTIIGCYPLNWIRNLASYVRSSSPHHHFVSLKLS